MSIQTWSDIQIHINLHQLPLTVMRFNMSLAGRLVDTASGEIVASTVDEAKQYLAAIEAPAQIAFDYTHQAWLENGKYVACGHHGNCGCYGKLHAGEPAAAGAEIH